ncbi:hypothetical protein BD289DRAFT_53570 [Coniella lustricola]|uniref:Secreted protein n=1 Tax=Coniella lustricola TaxID=2025994 RepID=A0A2T3A118_9PEZI|nr:hypothetical protein BD289DRAFT_53570 [Coniella lustricola]
MALAWSILSAVVPWVLLDPELLDSGVALYRLAGSGEDRKAQGTRISNVPKETSSIRPNSKALWPSAPRDVHCARKKLKSRGWVRTARVVDTAVSRGHDALRSPPATMSNEHSAFHSLIALIGVACLWKDV